MIGSRIPAARRLGPVLAVLLGLSLAMVATATDAHAAPSRSASPSTGLDPAKDTTVRVRGSGYDTSKGIYVAYCVVPAAGEAPSPCGGGADTSGTSGGSVWISNDPPPYGDGLAQPYASGGSFDVRITVTPRIGDVDCTRTACAVVTRNDHTRSSDRSQDVIAPVSFADPAPAPTTDPEPEPDPEPMPDPEPTAQPTPKGGSGSAPRTEPAGRGTTAPSASSSAGTGSTASSAAPELDVDPSGDADEPGTTEDAAEEPSDDEEDRVGEPGDEDAADDGEAEDDADGTAVDDDDGPDDVELPASALGDGRGAGTTVWVAAASALALGGATTGAVVWRRRRPVG